MSVQEYYGTLSSIGPIGTVIGESDGYPITSGRVIATVNIEMATNTDTSSTMTQFAVETRDHPTENAAWYSYLSTSPQDDFNNSIESGCGPVKRISIRDINGIPVTKSLSALTQGETATLVLEFVGSGNFRFAAIGSVVEQEVTIRVLVGDN